MDVSYTDRNGKKFKETQQVIFPHSAEVEQNENNEKEIQLFDNSGIRKAVVLSRYILYLFYKFFIKFILFYFSLTK